MITAYKNGSIHTLNHLSDAYPKLTEADQAGVTREMARILRALDQAPEGLYPLDLQLPNRWNNRAIRQLRQMECIAWDTDRYHLTVRGSVELLTVNAQAHQRRQARWDRAARVLVVGLSVWAFVAGFGWAVLGWWA